MEVLVSLFIMAMLATSGTAILIRSVTSQETLEKVSDDLGAISRVHTVLRDDLAQWVPRGFRGRDELGPEMTFFGGGDTDREPLLMFVRDGWTNPGLEAQRSGLVRVEYVLENGKLLRRTMLAANGVPSTANIEQVLLDEVQSLSFAFRQNEEWVPKWAALTASGGVAPVAVRLNFVLKDGTSYEWLFMTPAGSMS